MMIITLTRVKWCENCRWRYSKKKLSADHRTGYIISPLIPRLFHRFRDPYSRGMSARIIRESLSMSRSSAPYPETTSSARLALLKFFRAVKSTSIHRNPPYRCNHLSHQATSVNCARQTARVHSTWVNDTHNPVTRRWWSENVRGVTYHRHQSPIDGLYLQWPGHHYCCGGFCYFVDRLFSRRKFV